MSQALFLSTSKGNAATKMRRFGVLIDQVRFHEYINAVQKLIFVYLTELPRCPQNCRYRHSSFGRIQSLLHSSLNNSQRGVRP